jgi:hypothetical protein
LNGGIEDAIVAVFGISDLSWCCIELNSEAVNCLECGIPSIFTSVVGCDESEFEDSNEGAIILSGDIDTILVKVAGAIPLDGDVWL